MASVQERAHLLLTFSTAGEKNAAGDGVIALFVDADDVNLGLLGALFEQVFAGDLEGPVRAVHTGDADTSVVAESLEDGVVELLRDLTFVGDHYTGLSVDARLLPHLERMDTVDLGLGQILELRYEVLLLVQISGGELVTGVTVGGYEHHGMTQVLYKKNGNDGDYYLTRHGKGDFWMGWGEWASGCWNRHDKKRRHVFGKTGKWLLPCA